jgi:hypothetical protein
MRKGRLITGLALAGFLLGTLGAGAALAGNLGQAPSRPQAPVVFSGGPVFAEKIAASSFNSVVSCTAYCSLPDMLLTTAPVPAGSRAVLTARFTAESECYGGGVSPNWCGVRILVDGVAATPYTGTDFAFDSTSAGKNADSSAAAWQSHSMDRAIVVGPGPHTVKVQGFVTDFGHTGTQFFWTGERVLTVQLAGA